MLPDLWTAQTDAPPTKSLEIALRFPQHPPPKPKVFQRHNQPVHQIGAASGCLSGPLSEDPRIAVARGPSMTRLPRLSHGASGRGMKTSLAAFSLLTSTVNPTSFLALTLSTPPAASP